MKALVFDREERCLTIENVRRNGRIIIRKDGEYAMRGISWGWGKPAYPRWIWLLNFIPFIGPIVSNHFFVKMTLVPIAPGVPSTLEPRGNELGQSLTDEQALALMDSHAESMALGRKGVSPIVLLAIGAMAVAAIAILGLIARH